MGVETVTKVHCDDCGKEIPEGHGKEVPYISVAPDYRPNVEDYVFAVCIIPSLPRSFAFCGMGCLAKWAKENREGVSYD